MNPNVKSKKFHIAMFPWFAFGHINPFLLLSNELAKRGHKISFLLPNKAKLQLGPTNLHPDLIAFHTLSVPHVDPLPLGTETASDIPLSQTHHLATAMDLTRHQVESILQRLKPDLVFYDSAHWVPELAQKIGFKTVCYNVVCAASLAIALVPAREVPEDRPLTEAELAEPPSGYPSAAVVLRQHEARALSFISLEFGKGVRFYDRITTAMRKCDAIAIRTCQEVEGQLCNYIGAQYEKPVLLTGPVLPEPEKTPLDDRWAKWLDRFGPGSVVFCALGSQWVLEKDQFQEMVLGFEMTELPFLVAVKPPVGATTVEEALPEGFEERVRGRGVVHGGWVQQMQLLGHKSVGCFVNHCGFGSMWEGLMSESRLVLVPHLGDQILNTRLLADELRVAVEVEREESGWFSKESLSRAVKCVMGGDSEVGGWVKKNHAKWRETLASQGFMSGYIDDFIHKLHEI
ncbi:Anthocyanidin 3-O-glucoside 2'''-O-xylosyltransferase [Actinidia chinensis var. chinensis]|uniref:Anthocyanidin 3-O-glucoside 2'''-O-xylosyltransferase n=1 Tax=Actinidia chinensis var. chinensis TaxID=1590841 RepID=A0A2R6QCI1_ACTCC|nr:Anthocyanidin 3-O-glucoside 2'''-O-xylosyltransferase [Actinidia chinensis var. chinensis]